MILCYCYGIETIVISYTKLIFGLPKLTVTSYKFVNYQNAIILYQCSYIQGVLKKVSLNIFKRLGSYFPKLFLN